MKEELDYFKEAIKSYPHKDKALTANDLLEIIKKADSFKNRDFTQFDKSVENIGADFGDDF